MSTSKIPTLSYTLSLKRVPSEPPRIGYHRESPPPLLTVCPGVANLIEVFALVHSYLDLTRVNLRHLLELIRPWRDRGVGVGAGSACEARSLKS